MKAVWVDPGQDPHWETMTRHGINRIYFPTSDPTADVARRLADVKARNLIGGLYSAWSWYPGLTGAEYAEQMHQRVRVIAPQATNTWPKIMLDDETHDPARIAALLTRWRQLRPQTDTAWTLESMQGGWMDRVFANTVVNLKVRVVPQCYQGNMEPVDTLAAARDLTKRGFPDSLITPFYDAAKLPIAWDGFAFTAGRLP